MKILHLSTHDHGGAGTAAFRFHKNLVGRGINSKMLVLSKRTNDPNVEVIGDKNIVFRPSQLISRILLKLRTNPDYYFQDQLKSALDSNIDYFKDINYQPDLIVAHWISNYVSLVDLSRISVGREIPVIWYMMDMSPFTGGCHYAWGCTGYMNKCGNCPALYSNAQNDISARIWRKKYECIQQMNISVVAGSWLIKKAEMASLFASKRKERIMLGIDASIFKPCSRADARRELGLPDEKKILFVGSLSMKQRRKGMKYFLDAVRILEKTEMLDNQLIIMSAGNDSMKKYLRGSRFDQIHLGVLNENSLVKAYQSADVFVCPSIEEAGPSMVKESIMCGTPVVAFSMGVSEELVRTSYTGYRAALMDSNDLAKGISQILSLSTEDARKFSLNCRELGLKLSNEKVQIDKFIELANDILAQKSA